MPMPKDTHAVFDEILDDYRNGTIDADLVRSRITDAIKAEPALQAFKDEYLAWTDHDDTVVWLEAK